MSANRACANCSEKVLVVTDWKAGTKICTNCGMVMDESIIHEDMPEYRIFSEDGTESANAAKERTARVPRSVFESSVADEFNPGSDDKRFYLEGLRMVSEYFDMRYADGRAKAAEHAAKQIFAHAFQVQKSQKTPDEDHARAHNAPKKRQYYSRKVTYVVASIWLGHTSVDRTPKHITLGNISDFFNKDISEKSIYRAMKLINLNIDRSRATLKKRFRQNKHHRSACQRIREARWGADSEPAGSAK